MTDGSIPTFVEVTNTLEVGHTTGIQRLTRELLARLPQPGDGEPIEVRPIVWEPTHLKYRRLTESEADRLAVTPAPTRARRGRLDRVPTPVASMVRSGTRVMRRVTPGRRPSVDVAHLIVDPLPEGSMWLDLEAVWHGPVPRAELLAKLWAFGVPSAVMIPDVMPVLWPEWFEDRMARRFGRYLAAHLNHSDRVFCISSCTESDVRRVGAELAPGRELHTLVAPMGADHRRPSGASASLPGELVGRRFLLYVATVEPRKNHALLLALLDRLEVDHPDVAIVFVGKAGWKVADVGRRIEQHPRRGQALFWYQTLDDATLDSMYRHAFLTTVPSFYEGFGIPVVESLQRGVPVVSSDGGALAETGGPLAEYVAPDDLEGWWRVVSRHLDDDGWHAETRQRLVGYRPPSWDDCARVVVDGLSNLGRSTPGP